MRFPAAVLLSMMLGRAFGQQIDSAGAIRVFFLNAQDFSPSAGSALLVDRTQYGAMTNPAGEALITNISADSYRMLAASRGMSGENFQLQVLPFGVADTVVFLRLSPAAVYIIRTPNPADTLRSSDDAIYEETPSSRIPSKDTLSINSWMICPLDSVSVLSDGSTDLEASMDSLWSASFTGIGVRAGRLLHLLSVSRPFEGDSASIYGGDHARNGYLTLAPFIGLSRDKRKDFWNGELDILWSQAGPVRRHRTSVAAQCRVMREVCSGFGDWSAWFDDIDDINETGLLDSVLAVQVRLHLHTDDPRCTPVITSVRMIRQFI